MLTELNCFDLFPCQDLLLRFSSILSYREKEEFIKFNEWRNEYFLASATISDKNNYNCSQCINSQIVICFLPKYESHLQIETQNPVIDPIFLHFNCYNCQICLKSLPLTHFYFDIHYGLYCGRHFSELVKPRCISCDELIFSEKCVNINDKYWHLNHFNCPICTHQLDINDKESFVCLDDSILCNVCLNSSDNTPKVLDKPYTHNIYESIKEIEYISKLDNDPNLADDTQSCSSSTFDDGESDISNSHGLRNVDFNIRDDESNVSEETTNTTDSEFMHEYRKIFGHSGVKGVTDDKDNHHVIGIYETYKTKLNVRKEVLDKSKPKMFFDPRKIFRNIKTNASRKNDNTNTTHKNNKLLCRLQTLSHTTTDDQEFQYVDGKNLINLPYLDSAGAARNFFEFAHRSNVSELNNGLPVETDVSNSKENDNLGGKTNKPPIPNVKPLESISEIDEDIYKMNII